MSLNRPRLDLTITQASTFSGVKQALFLGHNVASNIEHPLALAACYRMGWDETFVCLMYITNK